MLDFTELSADGQDLELLVRELLLRRGFSVQWSGKGADGGRDLVCIERRDSFFVPDEKRWLIQCKHNAVSGKSVSAQDLDNIVDSCTQHGCTGYLLACSTVPSAGAINRLEAITNAANTPIVASYWDAVKLEQLLSTPRSWPIAQRFFPKSTSAGGWAVYGTERPNHWVAVYKGYYFHLTNRIGSTHEHHFESVSKRVAEIEAISLPDRHFIRIRAVHYDDKNGAYSWYLDYMYPNDQRPAMGSTHIAHALGDGYALDDGQIYHFDVRLRSYFGYSDHYDPDHYDYYDNDSSAFLVGGPRERDMEALVESMESEEDFRKHLENEVARGFDRLLAAFRQVPEIRIVRASNARFEALTRFNRRHSWSELIAELELQSADEFFSAFFLIVADDEDALLAFATCFPQTHVCQFRLTKAYIFVPDDKNEGSIDTTEDDQHMFELRVSVPPIHVSDMVTGRSMINDYFVAFAERIEAFVAKTRTGD